MDDFVDSLKILSEAFALYNRALFYYDPAFEEAGQKPANTGHKYTEIFRELPKEKDPNITDDDYNKLLFAYKKLVCLKTVVIYTETIAILSVSHSHIADVYTKIIEKQKAWRHHFPDRDPVYASNTTEAHLSQATEIASISWTQTSVLTC